MRGLDGRNNTDGEAEEDKTMQSTLLNTTMKKRKREERNNAANYEDTDEESVSKEGRNYADEEREENNALDFKNSFPNLVKMDNMEVVNNQRWRSKSKVSSNAPGSTLSGDATHGKNEGSSESSRVPREKQNKKQNIKKPPKKPRASSNNSTRHGSTLSEDATHRQNGGSSESSRVPREKQNKRQNKKQNKKKTCASSNNSTRNREYRTLRTNRYQRPSEDAPKGEDFLFKVLVTREELHSGNMKHFNFLEKQVVCRMCAGNMYTEVEDWCLRCTDGYTRGAKCLVCKGDYCAPVSLTCRYCRKGFTCVTKELSAKIEPGMTHGSIIILRGEANEEIGKRPGDLLVELKVDLPHSMSDH